MNVSKPHLFCFGLGYTAQALATRLAGEGVRISGTSRTQESVQQLKAQGWEVFLFDGLRPSDALKESMKSVTHLLLSIPPNAEGDPVWNHHRQDILQCEHLKWVGYLSTTGVYGDCQGEWVDESWTPAPMSARSQRRLDTENQWLSLKEEQALPLHIFRLPGIYGPGRNALVRVRQKKAYRVSKPGLVFCRIHVEDVAQVLQASINRPYPGSVYNVSDDCPAPPATITEHACTLLQEEPPPLQKFEEASLSEMARSFYLANKRVSNHKIKEELGVQLQYPDYRAGLEALLSSL